MAVIAMSMAKKYLIAALTFITIIYTSTAAAIMSSDSTTSHSLAIATRLHLGHASHPPPTSQLHNTLSSFTKLAYTIGANYAIVAVDAEEKLEGYNLVEEVTNICQELNDGSCDSGNGVADINSNNAAPISLCPLRINIHVLPVTPWGKFVPALNAIVSWCAIRQCQYLLLASAEVQLTPQVMTILKSKIDIKHTLVVGTVLNGHAYKANQNIFNEQIEEVEVELNGRTTPWNTCALWNVNKLALTGFLLVSEGLHDNNQVSAGVEEVCAIATLQRILQPNNAQAKLVSIPGASWEQTFDNDEKRKEWHEKKMQSKFTRAQRQLDLMGISGTVIHC